MEGTGVGDTVGNTVVGDSVVGDSVVGDSVGDTAGGELGSDLGAITAEGGGSIEMRNVFRYKARKYWEITQQNIFTLIQACDI